MGATMLKNEQADRVIELPGRHKEGRPLEMLLATLCVFSNQGRDEVSLSEFQESIAEFQRASLSLGYAYSDRFPYSLDVLADLKDLFHRGYIRQYNYRHDSFLPKKFLTLNPLGRGRGCKILDMLSEDERQGLKNAVMMAIGNHNLRWRLWSR